MPNMRTVFTTAATTVAVVTSLSAAIKFTSTWKHIDAGTVNFAGKKVAALVISKDDSLRIAGEESLVRELNKRGMQAVATYRIAPKEELAQPETAKPWFEKANIEGVVAVRPVSVESQTYTSNTWVTPYYSSLWGYYGYGWSTVYVPGGLSVTETRVVVETTIYSVPRNQLLWAAVTETTNTRDLPAFVQELVKRSVEVLQEQGLAKRVAK
jgi:hypothetical protein